MRPHLLESSLNRRTKVDSLPVLIPSTECLVGKAAGELVVFSDHMVSDDGRTRCFKSAREEKQQSGEVQF